MVGYLTEEQPAVLLAVLCVLEFGAACSLKSVRCTLLAVLRIWAVSPPLLDLGVPYGHAQVPDQRVDPGALLSTGVACSVV